MATFHLVPDFEDDRVIELVKGGPDVLLDRSSCDLWHGEIVPIDQVRADIETANGQLSQSRLRVLSFAVRRYPETDTARIQDDPTAQVEQLMFI